MLGELIGSRGIQLRPGYVADPSLEILLDKSLIAQIKIRQIELVISGLEAQLDLARMQHEMLTKEYRSK